MSKGAVSSLVFASSAAATSSFGYIFVNTAQQVKVKASPHTPDGKKRRFHLFGKVKDRKAKGKGAKYILSPVRGQHPTIIHADRLDETIDTPGDTEETEGTGTASRARRVQSAPASTLLRLEQQTRAQNEAREQAKLQQRQLNATSPTSPKSPHHPHPISPRAPTTPASTNKNKLQRDSREEGIRSKNNTNDNDKAIEPGIAPSTPLATKYLQPPQRIANSDDDDDDDSDWDEGISTPVPRPLRSSSIAFPAERSLPAERQKELVEQFEKSVKPCENWDDDFDLDVETEALQVPSAVAAAQFSVKMDLYNIHDFAKQIEALKNLRTEAQDISKAISDSPSSTRLEILRHTYSSDWEQAEVIIDLGEIANDSNPLAPPIRTVPKPSSDDTASDFVDFDEIDGPDADSPVNWGANLPSEKHLDVLKDILRNGLDAEGRRAIQPFLVGDSVQFSVEMMPGLLAHLKGLSERLEEHLTALRTLRTV